MKKLISVLFVACLVSWLIGLPAIPAQARTMYTRTAAELRGGTSLGASVVVRLEQGAAVEVLERSGDYYRVSAGAEEGWIYFNKLAEEKPEDIEAILSGGASGEGVELAELEAGGALRGLSPAAEKYADSAEIPDWAVQAVEEMQARKVGPEEIEKFAREGRLGEYGQEK
ncbi:MAG: SH3 domain-containing protein [Planctomycetes bacterium]|nr:SH3 domain-containing protein [Planctomycetota bacterium]